MTSIPPPDQCPVCEAPDVRVVEDVSDEVTIFGCDACGRTFADRADRADRADHGRVDGAAEAPAADGSGR